jgi:hypothetical protein
VGPCPRARPRFFPAPTATAALRDWLRRDKPSRHDAAISLGHDVGALLNSNRQKFQFTLNHDTQAGGIWISSLRNARAHFPTTQYDLQKQQSSCINFHATFGLFP